MKDSINHALLITGLLERDIARICASGNEAQQGLAADCAEHRRQLANKLRHIEQLQQVSVFQSLNPSTPEESRDRYEASAKAGDFNGDINTITDKQYTAELFRRENVERWTAYDRRKNRVGWALAAIVAIGFGAMLGGIKIWFTYFQP